MTDPRTPRLWPGTPAPLGATDDGTGVNRSVVSEAAESTDHGVPADDAGS